MDSVLERRQAKENWERRGALEDARRAITETEDPDHVVIREPLPNLPSHKEIRKNIQNDNRDLAKKMEALRVEMERNQRLLRAIDEIPILFDTYDFRFQLMDLKEVGIPSIKVGQREYTIKELKDIFGSVEEYIDENTPKKVGDKIPDRVEIDAFLSKMGVTRNKITEQSSRGFRDCMIEYILKRMNQEF